MPANSQVALENPSLRSRWGRAGGPGERPRGATGRVRGVILAGVYHDPQRRRLPLYRGRLLVAGVVSCAAVGPIVIVLGPILVGLLRDTLHLGCAAQPAVAGDTDWVCPDGIAYFVPGLGLAGALAGACFCVAAVRIVRSVAGRAPQGEVRRAAARDLAWAGGVPLVLQAPFIVFAGFVLMPVITLCLVLLLTAAAVAHYGEAPARSGRPSPRPAKQRTGDA